MPKLKTFPVQLGTKSEGTIASDEIELYSAIIS